VAKPDSSRTRRDREAVRLRAAEAARAEAARRAARRQGLIGIGVVVGVVLAVIGVIRAASNEQERKAATPGTTAAATTTTAVPVSLPPGPAGSALPGAPPCPPAGGAPTRVTRFAQAPPDCLTPGIDYTAEVHTSKGQITVDLQEDGPTRAAVNTFVFLARYRYYDGLPVTLVKRGAYAEVADAADTEGEGGAGGGASPGFRQPSAGKNQGNILTSLLFGLTPRNGTTGGGLTVGMPGDQYTTIAPDTTVLGTILDARTDRTPGAPDDQRTVLQLINDAASASGAPTQVITIDKVDIVEAPAR
jgi:hypothetical protein